MHYYYYLSLFIQYTYIIICISNYNNESLLMNIILYKYLVYPIIVKKNNKW